MKILVVVASGLHLGYVGCYGNDWVETPALDRLAAEGVVFDWHYADCPDGVAARRAWRTGCYHFPAAGAEGAVGPPGTDLIGMIREQGIVTALVLNGRSPSSAAFEAGWEHAWRIPVEEGDAGLERSLEAIQEALDRLAPLDRWLLWAELGTFLPPWEVPEDFQDLYFQEDPEAEENDSEQDESETAAPSEESLEPLPDPPAGLVDPSDDKTFARLQRTYAAAVTYLDTGLGELFEHLRERGLEEQVLIVLTTDRGLALGEHGLVGDGRPWLHDELVHLPLIIRLPGGVEAGRRCPALTQPVDLFPTLIDYFGLPAVAVQGRSLVPLIRGEVEQVRAYACSSWTAGGAMEWAIRTPKWGFLLPVEGNSQDLSRGPQLYVKPDDRWEVNNVIQHHPDLAEHLEKTLRGFVEATFRPGPLEPPVLGDIETQATEPQTGNEANPIPGGTEP